MWRPVSKVPTVGIFDFHRVLQQPADSQRTEINIPDPIVDLVQSHVLSDMCMAPCLAAHAAKPAKLNCLKYTGRPCALPAQTTVTSFARSAPL
jgi:hypothetical protein